MMVMRTFLGMVLGCLLTVAVVYVHDTMARSAVANGDAVASRTEIVNWDVASSEWGLVKAGIRTTFRTTWERLTADVG